MLIGAIHLAGWTSNALAQSLPWPHYRPLAPASVAGFHGLMYGPFRDNEDPTRNIFPSRQELSEDVINLAAAGRESGRPWFNVLGLYSSDHGFADIVGMGAVTGIQVIPGCFLNNSTNDDEEVNSLINALNNFATGQNIPFAMVGSEAVSAQHVGVDTLISRITQVRNATGNRVPIGTAEYWGTWLDNPSLADAVDVIMVNIYPYYEGYVIHQASDYTVQRLRDVQSKYSNRVALIGETGWPSEGETYGAAVANLANLEIYAGQIFSRSMIEGFGFLYFEAFDEKWKIKATGMENQGHFGLFTSQRNIGFLTAKGPIGSSLPPPFFH
jgi:exo-beta-1,3-glucanase (GH17 family)